IIHIQDAHANLSGQKSLAKALDEMMKKYELNLVMVEGSARDSSLNNVRKLAPLKEWGIIARRFLFDGIISGEEFLNLTSDHDMRIVGVEYRDLYDDAIKAYAALVDQRKDILHYLYRSKQAVDKLKQRLYPISLMDYENKKRQNEEDGGDFKASFEALMNIVNPSEITKETYPEILKLKQMHETEGSIDFNEANKEQMILMKQLKELGASDTVREFTASSKRVRNVQLSQYLLMRKVLSVAGEKGLKIEEFRQLTAYVDYLKSFTDLELEKLLNEFDILEDKTYMNILKEDEAKKVRAIDRFLGLLGNAYKLQMSSNEFKMLKFNEEDFPTESWLAFLNQQLVEFGFFEQLMPYKSDLEKARESLGDFYTLVDKRDEAFVQNAKQIMYDKK
ncbi:MAG: hypothetical protein KC649_07865, partial [Candidatus Omnitrophica bacterium]|nr:hypothetical protein [Candidatus Omnitrophota bacterium]